MPTRDEAKPAPATIITSERLQACRDVKPGTVLVEQDGTRMVVSNAYEAALAWWGRREAVRLAAALMASGVAMPDPWAEVTADDGETGAGVPRGEGLAVEVCELLVMVNEHPSEDGPFTIGEESGLDRGHAQDRILVKAYEVVESKVKATEGGADQGKAAGSQPDELELPVFPDIGCEGDCGFERRGVGWQCVASDGCGRYAHPGDEHFDALERYHSEMTRED